MSALARIDLDRLAKFCGLLGSSHDGERAAAALKADALVRAAGLTWPEILQPAAPTYRPADQRPRGMTPGEILARHYDKLNVYETTFLTSIVKSYKPLTEKQRAVLDRIRMKVAGFGR